MAAKKPRLKINLKTEPYPAQRSAIWANGERIVAVEASTKAGKTAGCLLWQFERLVKGGDNQEHWWVAPVHGQAKIAYTRARRMLARMPGAKSNDTDKTITLPGDRRWTFKSAEKPDNLYGEDVYSAVIDEASRAREEAWHAIRSTLTYTRGPIRIIGNVKGRRNWAYRLARRAEAGAGGMAFAKLTAYDAVEAGVLDAAEVEAAKRDLPDAVFRELYLGEPSDDHGNPFGMAAIAACVGSLSDGEPVAWGWDLAKSHDWCVGIALDEGGRVCRFERFQAPWEQTVGTIERLVGRTPALVDSTGVGDPIVERLQKKCQNVEGFRFSSSSKQRIMEGLAVAIQSGEVTFPDGIIRRELEAFEFVYTRTGVRYTAPEGMHDDCVDALALVVSLASSPARRYNLTDMVAT